MIDFIVSTSLLFAAMKLHKALLNFRKKNCRCNHISSYAQFKEFKSDLGISRGDVWSHRNEKACKLKK